MNLAKEQSATRSLRGYNSLSLQSLLPNHSCRGLECVKIPYLHWQTLPTVSICARPCPPHQLTSFIKLSPGPQSAWEMLQLCLSLSVLSCWLNFQDGHQAWVIALFLSLVWATMLVVLSLVLSLILTKWLDFLDGSQNVYVALSPALSYSTLSIAL